MSELGLATSLSPHTGSRETWSIVQEWVQQCSTQHQCLAPNNGWYPTRLLEWMPDDMFRVVRSDSESFCRGKRYITLSHKWGTGEFVRLCTNNLSDLEKGLPIKRLRKTFQDTLTVARRMDIPYVWIDSLCIIQSGDENDDWRHESQTMTEVYSNSFCNISADYGDEENGLFYARHFNDFDAPHKIQLRWKKSIPEATHLSPGEQTSPPEPTTCYIVCRTRWKEDLAMSPLNRRGWVMQERLLAPRILSFTPRMLSWKCGQIDVTEIWPRRVFHTPSLERLGKYPDPPEILQLGMQIQSQCHWGKQTTEELINMWYRIVMNYSGCELTHESDRLVAIAGVARKFRPVVNDQYVAGLWANSLPWALTWNASRHQRRQPSAAYYSPTFSWAACQGPVDIPTARWRRPRQQKQQLAAAFIKYRSDGLPPTSVQRPDDELLTDDVFGPLTSPEVEVRATGILRSCRLSYCDSLEFEFYAFPSASNEENWTKPQASKNRSHIFVSMDHEVNPEKATRAIFYYAVNLHEYHHDLASFAGVGLLLESVDTSMGRFKRVGQISLGRQHYSKHESDLLGLLGNEQHLPAWSFDEASREHTFYII